MFTTNIYSESAWPIKAKSPVKPPWEGRTKVFINGHGHMTKMAAIYVANMRSNQSYHHNNGSMASYIYTRIT